MSWPGTRLTELFGIRYPIVLAPMAGEPPKIGLAVAVSEAGALGTIASPLLSPDELREAIRAVRRLTSESPETRVLFISGHSRDALGERYGYLEGAPHLAKPFTFATLAIAIRCLVAAEELAA